MAYDQLPDRETIDGVLAALRGNGITAYFAEDGAAAKEMAVDLMPEGAQVMNMTSRTATVIGLEEEILKSGRYRAVRNRYATMDPRTQKLDMNRLGAAPEWVTGSVHAVTRDGHLLVASRTGSQMAAYVYGALKVLWVVGAQKIVEDLDDGIRRIYEYVLPLEDARAMQVYGTHSGVNKLLVINEELEAGRLHLILVNEALGF
jgi:hypothetical protein